MRTGFDEDEERDLPTQPAGHLDPPARVPPPAIGAATPEFHEHPERPVRHARSGSMRVFRIAGTITALLEDAFRIVAHKLVGR